jgi:hypothetical protein
MENLRFLEEPGPEEADAFIESKESFIVSLYVSKEAFMMSSFSFSAAYFSIVDCASGDKLRVLAISLWNSELDPSAGTVALLLSPGLVGADSGVCLPVPDLAAVLDVPLGV